MVAGWTGRGQGGYDAGTLCTMKEEGWKWKCWGTHVVFEGKDRGTTPSPVAGPSLERGGACILAKVLMLSFNQWT